jgi:hypothetical protein
MARRTPAARWIVVAGVLLVAGFFAALGLTSVLTGGDEGSDAQETPAVTPAPGTGLTEPVDVEVSAPTGEEEPQAAETDTVDPVKDTVRAPCSVDEIRFLFDRETGTLAVFSGDGRPIASVARDSYIFEGELCRGLPAGVKHYSYGGLHDPVYESGGVSCSAPRGVEVEIHPILDGNTGGQAGNVLLVSVRGRPTVLASGVVVEDPPGRRFWYSARHCSWL